jgi:hypothetical protein
MTTRSRPMAIDNHSLEADDLAGPVTLAKVQAEIVTLLIENGPLTDDDLAHRYLSEQRTPMVTPQRLRTARSALVRIGRVKATPEPGLSQYGNPSTRWAAV